MAPFGAPKSGLHSAGWRILELDRSFIPSQQSGNAPDFRSGGCFSLQPEEASVGRNTGLWSGSDGHLRFAPDNASGANHAKPATRRNEFRWYCRRLLKASIDGIRSGQSLELLATVLPSGRWSRSVWHASSSSITRITHANLSFLQQQDPRRIVRSCSSC